jgi:hypothetical protein
VPDCGLDEHGERVFDFGPRKFGFVLGPLADPSPGIEPGDVASAATQLLSARR